LVAVFDRSFPFVCFLVATFASIPTAKAQNSDDMPLSAAEVSRAVEIESRRSTGLAAPAQNSSASKGLADTKSAREGKSIVVSVRPIGSGSTRRRTALAAPADSKLRAERVLVTRFIYTTGRTVETLVDLGDNAVLGVKAHPVGYPTPLANEEQSAAKRILIDNVPAFASFVQANATAEFFYFPNSPRRATSSLYGHRLVLVWGQARSPSPSVTERFLVDLSTETIISNQ